MKIRTKVNITDEDFKITNESVSGIVKAVDSPGVRVNILNMHTQKGVLAAKNNTNPKGIARLESPNGAGETDSYTYETFLVINGKEYSFKDMKYNLYMNDKKFNIINNIYSITYFGYKKHSFKNKHHTEIKINHPTEKTESLIYEFDAANIENIINSVSFGCDFNKVVPGSDPKKLKWKGKESYIEINGKKVPKLDNDNNFTINAETKSIFISYLPNKKKEFLFNFFPNGDPDYFLIFVRDGNRLGFGGRDYFYGTQDTSAQIGGDVELKENEFNSIFVDLKKKEIYVNGEALNMDVHQHVTIGAGGDNISRGDINDTSELYISNIPHTNSYGSPYISQIVCFNESFSNEIIKTITPDLVNTISSNINTKHPNVIHATDESNQYIPPFTAYDLTTNANDITGKNNAEAHNIEFTTDGKYKGAKFTGGVLGANTYNNGIHIPGDKIKNLKEFTFACKAKGSGVLFETDYFEGASTSQATGWALFTWMVDKAIADDKKITINFDEPDDSEWHTWIFTINHYGEAAVYLNSKRIASGNIAGKPYYNGQSYADTGTNIGASYDTGFTGFIKNVVIMDKALTDDESQALNDIIKRSPNRLLKLNDTYRLNLHNAFKKYYPYTYYPLMESLNSCLSKERYFHVNGNQNVTFDSKHFKGLFFDGGFSINTTSKYVSQIKSFSASIEITMNDFGSKNSNGSRIQPFFEKGNFSVMAYNDEDSPKFALYDGDYKIKSDIDLADGKTHLLYFTHEDGVKNTVYIDNKLVGTSKASKLSDGNIIIGDHTFRENGHTVHNMLESTYVRNLIIKEGVVTAKNLKDNLNNQRQYYGLGEKLLFKLLSKNNGLDVSKIKTDDKTSPYQIRICGYNILKYIPADPEEESYTIKFITKDNIVELYINNIKEAEFDTEFFNQELTLVVGDIEYVVGADDIDTLNTILEIAEEL